MSKPSRLVEVKIHERGNLGRRGIGSLEGYLHPDRVRLTNCWQDDKGRVCNVGRKGWWDFIDGYEPDFLCMGEAWVVGEIDENREGEEDRLLPADWE